MPDKKPKIAVTVGANKKPSIVEEPESYFCKRPAWRFSRADTEHAKWSVLDIHEDIAYDESDPGGTSILHIFSQSIDKVLFDSLKKRESTIWSVLLTQSGGRTHGTNSHHVEVYKLTDEAQKRAVELGIDEDELFSLRIDGTHRVWGILQDGILDVIWFDRDHSVCPSQLRGS